MKISRSAEYALIAAGYIADNHQDGAILATKISNEYGVSVGYLLKILQQLVRAGVLRSKRGPRGGFALARPPEHITLLQLIEALDGPLTGDLSLSELTGGAPFSVKMEAVCRKATEDVRDVLGSTVLSDFIGT